MADHGFAAELKRVEAELAKRVTAAMRDEDDQMKGELREQVVRAGLGRRLANTWRSKLYPARRDSLTPAVFAYSKAPDIIRAFSSGATIVPVNGSETLAIPSDNVPMVSGGRGSRRRMTPEEVEVRFNQDLILRRGKSGNTLGFVDATGARNGKGFKRLTPGRAAQGRKSRLVLMFTFVRSIRMPRLLDPRAVLNRAAARLANRIGD